MLLAVILLQKSICMNVFIFDISIAEIELYAVTQLLQVISLAYLNAIRLFSCGEFVALCFTYIMYLIVHHSE